MEKGGQGSKFTALLVPGNLFRRTYEISPVRASVRPDDNGKTNERNFMKFGI